jgi:hypothetical protein
VLDPRSLIKTTSVEAWERLLEAAWRERASNPNRLHRTDPVAINGCVRWNVGYVATGHRSSYPYSWSWLDRSPLLTLANPPGTVAHIRGGCLSTTGPGER